MAERSRTIWNGTISFGLVYIPVTLHSAANEAGLDFDWIDKRSMDLVGYKRINKMTGEDIEKENIVRGIEFEKGKYVILTDEEIKRALVKSTQTIELESFVSVDEIPLMYFEKPYYLAPNKSDKAYALLRETLSKTKRVGIGRIVMHNRQHMAAIVPDGSALVLIILRWENQFRSLSELKLPSKGNAGLTQEEIAMAEQLVAYMVKPWNPKKLKDTYVEKVMMLVEEKAKTGQIESVLDHEVEPDNLAGAEIIDYTELLKKSLKRKNTGSTKKALN